MVTFLLDTNTVIASLNGHEAVGERLRMLAPEQALLCAPVLAELTFGAMVSARREQNLERLRRLASITDIIPFDEDAAYRFGQLKAQLRTRGITKTDFDLAIAAIALECEATLVSNDHAFHDKTIEGLQVEDWLRS